MRVLVCGGRHYADENKVKRVLGLVSGQSQWADVSHANRLTMLPPQGFTLIHGDCPTGADRYADEWGVVNWVNVIAEKADWDLHGRLAGPIRNQKMLDAYRPDIVVAFPGGAGTADMVRRARKAGVLVLSVS